MCQSLSDCICIEPPVCRRMSSERSNMAYQQNPHITLGSKSILMQSCLDSDFPLRTGKLAGFPKRERWGIAGMTSWKKRLFIKVGLMHDPTTSRDLRDNGSVLTKNRMASAGGGNREI